MDLIRKHPVMTVLYMLIVGFLTWAFYSFLTPAFPPSFVAWGFSGLLTLETIDKALKIIEWLEEREQPRSSPETMK